ncbi:MAG: AzlC family ABC transporter permease [Candidatus Nanopelagicales bacterium]
MTTDPTAAPEGARPWVGVRGPIVRTAVGIGLATGAYGVSFGALSVASGLSPLQTQTLSAVMFTGASQFALIGVLGSGGGAIPAVLTAWMLGARNTLYGLRLSPLLQARGWRRPVAAHMTIDESTAMALGQDERAYDGRAARLAFWSTGLSIYLLWNLATLVGALGAAALGDPRTLGLDAAIPAGFLALLWPQLRSRQAWAVALAGAAVALALTPVLRPGLPVLAAAAVAVLAGLRGGRTLRDLRPDEAPTGRASREAP